MFVKKKCLEMLAVIITVLLLAACGGNESSGDIGPQNGPQDVEQVDTGENEQVEPVTEDVVEDVVEDVTDEVTVDTLEDTAEIVTVNDVIHGDTIEIVTEDGSTETVRLLLADTPASSYADAESGQLYGDEARIAMTYAVDENATVYLERSTPDKDSDGNTLGFIWIDNEKYGSKPVNMSKFLVEYGLARVLSEHESYVSNAEFLEELQRAELQAKDERLNIWYELGYVSDDGFDMSLGGHE